MEQNTTPTSEPSQTDNSTTTAKQTRKSKTLASATGTLSVVRYGVPFDTVLGTQERGNGARYPSLAPDHKLTREQLCKLLLGEKGEELLDAHLTAQLNAEMLRLWGTCHNLKDDKLQKLLIFGQSGTATPEEKEAMVERLMHEWLNRFQNPNTRQGTMTPEKLRAKYEKRTLAILEEAKIMRDAYSKQEITKAQAEEQRDTMMAEMTELKEKINAIKEQEARECEAAFNID